MSATAPPVPTFTSEPAAARPALVRGIGRWTLVAMMVNGIVGAGIFGLPSRVHALLGPVRLAAYVACGTAMALIAVCFAEVASRFSGTGGPYLYAHVAFGPVAGFLLGWIMWLTRVTALASIARVMASYLAVFWPFVATARGADVAIAGVLGALLVLNLAGVRHVAHAVTGLTLAKLAPLALFVAVGAWFVRPPAYAVAVHPTAGAFGSAVLLLVFAFGGFEAVVITAGEMRDPRGDTPFALALGIGVAALLYVAVQAVCVGTLPSLAASERPIADAAAAFAGAPGAGLMALGALVSTLGTLGASMFVGSRVVYAMAERRQLPTVLGSLNPRFATPHAAIALTAGVAIALALTGTFTSLVTLNVLARLATYASTALALLVLRRRPDAPPAAWRAPAGGWIALLALVACGALVARSSARDLLGFGLALAAGLALFGIARAQLGIAGRAQAR